MQNGRSVITIIVASSWELSFNRHCRVIAVDGKAALFYDAPYGFFHSEKDAKKKAECITKSEEILKRNVDITITAFRNEATRERIMPDRENR